MSEEVKYISKIKIEDNNYNIKDDNVREAVGYYEEGVLVDLGLPSGTLWAKTNIGADSETDFGLYFAWGETEGYTNASSGKAFSWNDYKYGTYNNITKYNDSDGLTLLTNDDDAAYANSDGLLRMPTREECLELLNNTNHEWTTINGINGRKFTNKNDSSKYIFIPAAGICYDGSVRYVGNFCCLWSSSRSSYADHAWYLYCDSNGVSMNSSYRCYGQSVRGVGRTLATRPKSTKADKVRNCQPGNFPALDAAGNLIDSGVSKDSLSNYYEKNQTILMDNEGIYQIKDTSVYPVSHPDLSTQPSILPLRYGNLDINEVLIANGRESEIPDNATIISAFSFNLKACVPAICEKDKEIIVREEDRVLSIINPNDENLVDLGLPSGTLWAKKNLGANSETDYGLYFAWGETEGYHDASSGKGFTWDDYKYGTSDNITKYNDSDGLILLDTSDDAVFFDSDEMYVMPTKELLEELKTYTNSEWITINGVNGRKFTNKNDSSKYIFIPAAGICSSGSVFSVGYYCYLWSSSRDSGAYDAWCLYCGSDGAVMYGNGRCSGRSVRGVGRTYTNFKVIPQNLLDNLTLQNKTNDEVLNKVLSGNSLHFTSQDGTTIDGFIDIINNQPTFVNTNHPELVKYTYIDPEKIPITKVILGWSIYNFMNIVPEFTLIQYVNTDNGSYYYYYPSGDDGDDFIIPEFIDEDDGLLVDLGLPSGTLWAKSNLGASSPSQYGLYYAWGETTGYTDASTKLFSWNDYAYGTSSSLTKYNDSDGLTLLETSDDVVYQSTNGNLVMPTQEQLEELKNNTYNVWYTTQNGVKGSMFISKVDNSKYIFIPAAGICDYGSVYSVGINCCLWSSSRDSSASSAWCLFCGSNEVNVVSYSRCYGQSVRGVGRTL